MIVPRETSMPCAPTLVLPSNSVSAERVDCELCDIVFDSILCSWAQTAPDAREYAAPHKRFAETENLRAWMLLDLRDLAALTHCHERTCIARMRAIASQISVRWIPFNASDSWVSI